jgi:type IV secretion system protein VirB10
MKKKEDKLSHLSQSVKAGREKNSKIITIIFLALAIIGLLCIMLLSHNNNKTKKSKSNNVVNLQSNVLNSNEQRLIKLEQQRRLPIQNPIQPIENKKQTAELLARQNAPTDMYQAKPKYKQETVTSTSSLFPHNNVYGQFANSQSQQTSSVYAKKLQHPNFTILQGEMIHAILATAINSDLPGMVSAVVSRPVYSYLGERLLVPAGSRVIGQYASLTGNGAATARVFVIWNRVITPNGLTIIINSPGADSLGRSGLTANTINTHFFKIFGTASLLSLMSATTATYGVNSYQQPNSANQFQQSIANSFQQAAQNSLGSTLRIKPTLIIHQGDAVTIFVARDLDFYKALEKND